MDELVQFLRARLDEDERNARNRSGIFPSPGVDDDGAVWLHVRPGGNAVIVRYRDPVAGYDDMAELRAWANTESGWTHARVLAEVEAKRRLIALHEELENAAWRNENDESTNEQISGLYFALRFLALPYADHPAYREEWRP